MSQPDRSPDHAFVFAAGKGERMRPLTDDKPKPMVEIGGQPLLGHMLDRIFKAGIPRAIINMHYKAEKIETYAAMRLAHGQGPTLTLSDERAYADPLLQGGGIRLALEHKLMPPDAPILTANADILYTDGLTPAIARLIAEWNRLAGLSDALLLLVNKHEAWGHDSKNEDGSLNGDYTVENGQLTRCRGKDSPLVFAGLQIIRPALFAGYPLGQAFSSVEVWDTAQRAGRLHHIVHDGGWFHFSRKADVDLFNMTKPHLAAIP